MYTAAHLGKKTFSELKAIACEFGIFPAADRRCRQNWIDAIVGVNPPLLQLLEVSPALEEVEPVAEAIASVDPVQEPLIETLETSPGVESDRHPILRGVTLSNRFLACYSSPQAQIIHFQSEADGQLSLLDFEVQSEPEPPDPDDFESLDAFREAIARWDTENPELLAASIDSMCEWAPCPEEWYWSKAEILPLKASSTIDLSLPSEQSEVMELSIAGEGSITCNFFIPIFDAWCDRFNRSDEPPDTGIYARLPKPKLPSFPPTAVGQARVKRIPNAAQTQSKRISNAAQLHTIHLAAGNNSQSGRDPPGGDASF